MNKATGVTRIIKAIGYSLKGLKQAWQHEAAFRQELMLLVVAVLVACWFPVSLLEHHELSGRAKDIGSAAVFVALVFAAVVWVSILWSLVLG